MARIAVFGATGGTGREVVQQALGAGHEVVVLARTPSKLTQPVQRVVEGDVRDVEAVRRTIAGADAVVVALGMPARDRSGLREAGTRAVAEAMAAEGVERLVVLSVLGAHESHQGLDWFTRRLVFPLWLNATIRDHEAQETVVRRSALDWTLVRPPHLTDQPGTGSWTAGFDMTQAPPAMTLTRADLAGFLLHCAVDGAYRREAVGVVKAVARRAAA